MQPGVFLVFPAASGLCTYLHVSDQRHVDRSATQRITWHITAVQKRLGLRILRVCDNFCSFTHEWSHGLAPSPGLFPWDKNVFLLQTEFQSNRFRDFFLNERFWFYGPIGPCFCPWSRESSGPATHLGSCASSVNHPKNNTSRFVRIREDFTQLCSHEQATQTAP